MSISISELNIYPVKSCRGFRVHSAIVTKRGFTYDRAWMVVDERNQFITQRTHPAMALIEPEVLDRATEMPLLDQSTCSSASAEAKAEPVSAEAKAEPVSAEAKAMPVSAAQPTVMQHPYEQVMLKFSAPNMPSLATYPDPRGQSSLVTVWDDTCQAIDEGDEVAAWLSTYLKISCRLVRMADDWVRRVDPQYGGEQDQVGFADGYPFLLISAGSLDDLNGRLEQALPMNRFRPNIVVSGCPAFAEDTWRLAKMGACEFRVVKPCDRCVITTTDQETGRRGQEPLKTLARYRNSANKVLFGQNLIPETAGLMRVGDPVHVLSYN